MLVLAHLSDLHLDTGRRARRRTQRAVDYLRSLPSPVDAILVTGDVTDHGTPEEYEEARAVLGELADLAPTLACPGNHDRRAAFRQGLLGRSPEDGPINQAREVGGTVLAMCDTVIPASNSGEMDAETLGWLERTLEEAGQAPVFLGFHHPPVDLYAPFVDQWRQQGEQRLAELVDRHPGVVALLCGHAHTAAATTFAGRPLLVAPAMVSTVKLAWEEARPPVDTDPPPMLAFHVYAEGRLTTHLRSV